MRVAVLGLGKIGACLAAVLAEHHDVIGFDVNPAPVNRITAGAAPVDEPGLADLVRQRGGRSLRATTLVEKAATCEVAFVVVPTPSDEAGRFDNRHVLEAVSALGTALQGQTEPFTVAIVSTVMPGSCAGPISAALIGSSGRTDVGLVYNPAFIALGSVVHDLTNPDMVLLGCDDNTGAETVARALLPCLQPLTDGHAMSLIDAELAKLSLNVALAVKVAYAHEVAQVCERLGGDATAVLAAVGADTRIGSKFLAAGPTASGPCLPRDVVAFHRVATDGGCLSPMAAAARNLHNREAAELVEWFFDVTDVPVPIIGILGAAYKPGTAVTDASIGVRVAERALAANLRVVMHDPKADLSGLAVGVAGSGRLVVEAADVVLIATPWPEYKTLDFRGKPVLDLWGEAPTLPNVHRFGVGR